MFGATFIVAFVVLASVCAIFKPFIGFLAYVCLGLLAPEEIWGWALPSWNYSRIVAIGTILGWVANGFGNWQFGRGRIVLACLLAYCLWVMASLSVAKDFDRAWPFIENLLKTAIPWLIGLTTIQSRRQIFQLAWVITLTQGYVCWELNRSYFEGFNRLTEIGYRSMDNNCMAIALNSCIGVGLFLSLGSDRWWLRLLALGSVLLMIHTVLFSFSRGGMIGLAVTFLTVFLLIPKRLPHYFLFFVALLVSLRLAGPQVQERFFTAFADTGARDNSAQSRLELWGNCLECVGESPLLGLGPNQFGLEAPRFGWPLGKEAHTLWLQLAAELGLPAITCLILFYALCVGRLFNDYWRGAHNVHSEHLIIARMVVASTIGFAISAQFVTLPGLEVPYYVCLMGAASLMIDSREQASELPEEPFADEFPDEQAAITS